MKIDLKRNAFLVNVIFNLNVLGTESKPERTKATER